MALTVPCVAVVPAHRAERTIARTIRSLQAADPLAPARVLVVASPVDATAEIAERMGVEVVRTSRRLSAGAARALGRRVAGNAEFLLFVDADCAPRPEALAALWSALESRRLDAAGASVEAAPATTIAWVRHALEFKDSEPGAPSPWPAFVPSATLLCRAAAYDAVGGFPDLWPGEDLVLCSRLARAGYRVRRVDGAVTVHRHPPGFAAMLRHQFALGTTSARARSWEPLEGAAYLRHPLASVPLLFAGRTTRMLGWLRRRERRERVAFLWRAPLYWAGLASWCAGFATEARRTDA